MEQKDDLENQIEFLRTYANAKGIITDKVMKGIGSGLNYNHKIMLAHRGELSEPVEL